MPDHSKEELEIFDRFLAACSPRLDVLNPTKRDPPEPDIHCQTADGGECYFELVQVIDQGLATGFSSQQKLQEHLEQKVQDPEFRKKYSDAMIVLGFAESLSMRERQNLVPKILRVLMALESSFEGKVNIGETPLASKLKRLEVSRGLPCGPKFFVDSRGFLADPTLETVMKKVRKRYELSAPVSLLAYFEMQPMLAGTPWGKELPSAIRSALRFSDLREAWLFELGTGRVERVGRDEGGTW